ncbi:polysaccharide biosynthesis/export family protein [Cypionkella sp. TWP1-2-1b2]|uniref:polysaccharide biosynthesis/export family protein n=1 Tax=Cypionkella sp. TWP1-2-1b2 TaxID=2804675 RepID=UPI003CF10FDF
MKTLIALLIGFMLVSAPVLAQEGYLIHPGDVLQIEVLEDPGMNRSALVAPDGRITMPLAGAINVAGQSVEAVQSDIAGRLASNFAAPPNVYVSLQQLAAPRPTGAGGAAKSTPTIDVYVMGQVGSPGKIAVVPGTTMLQIIAQMGGFSDFAATKRIQLRRIDKKTGVEKTYNFNYKALENGQSTALAATLADGDVIIVPTRRLFE